MPSYIPSFCPTRFKCWAVWAWVFCMRSVMWVSKHSSFFFFALLSLEFFFFPSLPFALNGMTRFSLILGHVPWLRWSGKNRRLTPSLPGITPVCIDAMILYHDMTPRCRASHREAANSMSRIVHSVASRGPAHFVLHASMCVTDGWRSGGQVDTANVGVPFRGVGSRLRFNTDGCAGCGTVRI